MTVSEAVTRSTPWTTWRSRRREVERAEPRGGGDDLLVREGDIAGDYLEQLLDLLDYDGDIDLDVEGSARS